MVTAPLLQCQVAVHSTARSGSVAETPCCNISAHLQVFVHSEKTHVFGGRSTSAFAQLWTGPRARAHGPRADCDPADPDEVPERQAAVGCSLYNGI